MDAQNAAEPASTKPAASPKRPGSDADSSRPSAVTKLSSAAKPDLSVKDSSRPSASGSRLADDDGTADGNSDAETIVLPGKDGHSPSKARKIVKHDLSDAEDVVSGPSRKHSSLKTDRGDGDKADRADRGDRGDRPEKSSDRSGAASAPSGSNETSSSLLGKKKKLVEKKKPKDGSSGLSSAPASPPQPQRRRRASNAHQHSDSEAPAESTTKSSVKEKDKDKEKEKEKSKLPEKSVPLKRKALRPDSDDEAEPRKIRRQRTSGSGLDASRKHHPPLRPHHEAHPPARNRSVSPNPKPHRRTTSTQLPSHSSAASLGQKKKRVPAPLQATDYLSDESSASGSPHPRSSKLRGLATPATAESTVSPAKMAPHKKHLDAHGQTFLARACAKGEYEIAKQRLQERPEDINVADYAGNTPLQIAALNGYDDIVRLLVDAGCNLDCVNNDKDTPLIDAVENGHLDVVKILLEAGVNPRKANARGEEPIDRVNDDLDNAEEIRQALREAREKMGDRRRTSEEHHTEHVDARSSHGPDSPRRSPGVSASATSTGGRRAGTIRATKTSNHLLYMPMDDKTLRMAAAKGDEETVTRILQVRENFDDPESMVAAARGGHDIVMQLLLALGRANPDPPPITTVNSEYSTPMLAAIGQENIKVVKLLLDQSEFDPTRRIKGETYYEIARRRRGPNWMEEEHMLKEAYDAYKKNHKETSRARSPERRENKERQEREAKRKEERREERKDESKDKSDAVKKRKAAASPTREPKASSSKLATSPKEKRRPTAVPSKQDEQTESKRGPGRPKKDDRIPTISISDRDPSPAGKSATKIKRAESDLAAASSEGESPAPPKPRRKLVSGRELKTERERERQRRPSLTSNASSLKEPSSPREESDKPSHKTEKYHDRTKALKRDESRDRLSVSGDSAKRYRSSATPPHLPSDKDAGDGTTIKKRRLEVPEVRDKEKRPKSSHSTDEKPAKSPVPRDSASGSSAASKAPPPKPKDDEDRKPTPKPKKPESVAQARRESGKSTSSEGSIHVKSEDADVEMTDAPPLNSDSSRSRVPPPKEKDKEKDDDKKKQAEHDARAAREAKRAEEEAKRKEEEEEAERQRREAEAKKRAEAEAKKREEEEQQRWREEEERERKRKEEEERKKREEEERRQREEEERQRKLEEERKKREEEERKRREEEERKKREEEERKKREEEERLRREQQEREAAEEARRKEEERKEQERLERRRAERAAKEADQQRRIRLELERQRLAKLPPLLRWLDGVANPKSPEIAKRFSIMQGVRYDCLNPEANGTREGREQWLLNTQVALLLGEKDPELPQYTAWRRIPATQLAKRIIWRLESDRYALTTPTLFDLGEQLQDYYQGQDPQHMSYAELEKLRGEAWEKFAAMDMFFVKASDFFYIVPTIQHLRNVKLTVVYCELPENEHQCTSWVPPQKWKRDPDANNAAGFAPRNKHYINGELVSEDKPLLMGTSPSPFQRPRSARRRYFSLPYNNGSPTPARSLKRDQGEDVEMAGVETSLRVPNGLHSPHTEPNGVGSPTLASTTPTTAATTNGATGGGAMISPPAETGPGEARPLVNGVHGGVNGTN
ncbi:hypothetical protein VTJ04DRAFT_628 [Mycothermus thermophilus]|uniref:uncharacterized protein n=1 Tax=Humicola insolens TaxID=85995 RepID=UPI003741FF7E